MDQTANLQVADIPDIALTQQFPGQVLSTGSAAILLLQNCSSIRSFMDVEVPRTESSLSLRSGSTQATQDEAYLRCGNPNGSYRKPQVTWENPP